MSRSERQLSRHGEDRKRVLLDHAEALLLERGYNDTRMLDVATAAGVTKGLLYWYFDSKEELFRQIIEDVRQRSRRAISDATGSIADDDVLAQVYVGTVAAVRFGAAHIQLYSLIWGAEGFIDARLEAAERDATDTGQLLARGQQQGQIRDDEQAKLLARLNAGVVTASFAALTAGSPVATTAHAAARYAVHALAPSDADAARIIAAHQPKARARKRHPRS